MEVTRFNYLSKDKKLAKLITPKEVDFLGVSVKQGPSVYFEDDQVKIDLVQKKWVTIKIDLKDKDNPVINISSFDKNNFSLDLKDFKVNFKKIIK
jgi:hypothetical protein